MKYKASKYNVLIDNNDENYYLYNTYSGSLCKFNKKQYEEIINMAENKTPEAVDNFNDILSQGFVVDNRIDEFNRVIQKQYIAAFDYQPIKLGFVIAPTLKCNFKCVYCFESQSCKSDGFSAEKIETVLQFIIKKVESNPQLKYLSVDWFGGEPMLKYNEIVDFSQKLIKYCESKNIIYSACMLTNGFLLTKKKAQVLKEKCKLTSVQIPLDGMKETYCKFKQTTEKSFEKVIHNIIDISDILNVQIRLNANKQNYESIKHLAKFLLIDCELYKKIRLYLAELKFFEGYTSMSKSVCFESVNFAKVKIDFLNYIKNELKLYDFKFMYNKPKVISCGLCKMENYVIGPECELYRCEHHVGRSEEVVGDCVVGRFFSNSEMRFFIPKYKNECKKCNFYPSCFCGCRSNFQLNGIDKDFCEGIKYELINSLKQKIADIENKINSDYGKKR